MKASKGARKGKPAAKRAVKDLPAGSNFPR